MTLHFLPFLRAGFRAIGRSDFAVLSGGGVFSAAFSTSFSFSPYRDRRLVMAGGVMPRRGGHVVDLEREAIPAGEGFILIGGRVVGEPVPAAAIMTQRTNVPQHAVGQDVNGVHAFQPDRAYWSGWLCWPEPLPG